MPHFILNDQHEPVEVDLETACKWEDRDIGNTTVALNTRVWTIFLGYANEGERPPFVHYVFEPGHLYRTVNTYGYDKAVARHERIAEWLKKRAVQREERHKQLVAGNSK